MMLAQLSRVHGQGCRKMVMQIRKIVASAAVRQSCELHLLSYVLQHSCGSRAIKRKVCRVIMLQSYGIRKPIRECKLLRKSYKHLACLEAALHTLQQSYVLIRSHKNHKENEHVKNLLFVVVAELRSCDIVRQSCGVAHNTLRLPHITQKFVVIQVCTAAIRLM